MDGGETMSLLEPERLRLRTSLPSTLLPPTGRENCR